MLNTKNHILIVLATALANVVEIKANVVKFPFGREKASIDDLSDDDKEAVTITVSSVNIVDKNVPLRNDTKGISIDTQVGKVKTIAELKEMVNSFNEDMDTELTISVPELDYFYQT